jgi:hypothetical protein
MVIPFDVPVDPTAPVAQQWVIDELSKSAYQSAKPTLFDQISKAIQDWLNSLKIGSIQGPPALGVGVLVLLVIVAIIIAFLVFGAPRLNNRSSVTGALFGDADARDAAAIRRDAEAAARADDFSLAIIEMFRALARGLAERTVVVPSPGTTARDFALEAALAFPAFRDQLGAAAVSFDAVRYLDHESSREQYDSVAGLERELASARPAFADPTVVGA